MSAPPEPIRHTLDPLARRIDGGRVVIGGSPLTVFRLSSAGAGVLDALIDGRPRPAGDGPRRLVQRLTDAGVLHPLPGPGRWKPDDVTVVIPVLDADPGPVIERLGLVHEVIVVDDGSDPPLAARHTVGPHRHPVRLLRRDTTGGPGAARTTGLGAVTTPLVAFVDVDTEPDPGWLEPLLGHFEDPAVALVAPRVRSVPGSGGLARYEAARSPLDLGPAPARVRARTRVAYVPAAAVVARVDAVRATGGFRAEMRVGEDVDLVWRLDEAGYRVRYEPASVVGHRPRAGTRWWLAQRFGYGRSAGPLARHHPGALVPVGVSAWSLAVWLAAAARRPVVGAGIGLGSALALADRLKDLDHPVAEALRMAGAGHLYAGRQLASAVTRTWWPVALGAAVASRRARRAVVAAALLPAVADWWRETRRGDHDLPAALYIVLRLADDAAYGAGVWRGVVEAHTLEPLRPDLTNWPRPSRYHRPRRGPAASAGHLS